MFPPTPILSTTLFMAVGEPTLILINGSPNFIQLSSVLPDVPLSVLWPLLGYRSTHSGDLLRLPLAGTVSQTSLVSHDLDGLEDSGWALCPQLGFVQNASQGETWVFCLWEEDHEVMYRSGHLTFPVWAVTVTFSLITWWGSVCQVFHRSLSFCFSLP